MHFNNPTLTDCAHSPNQSASTEAPFPNYYCVVTQHPDSQFAAEHTIDVKHGVPAHGPNEHC